MTSTAEPTRAMWWAEWAVFLAVTAAALRLTLFALSLATGHRSVSLGAGPSAVLLALSIGVGAFAGGRFRAWRSHRRSPSPATQP